MTPLNKAEVLRAACCIAMIDQELDDREAQLLEDLAFDAGVGRASLNAMIDRARRDPNFFEHQFRVLKSDPADTMRKLFEVAVSDKGLDEAERVVLHHFAGKLDLDDQQFEKLLSDAEKQVGSGDAG